MSDIPDLRLEAPSLGALADVLAEEAQGWPADLPKSTFDVFALQARLRPDAPAISFFADVERHRDVKTWSYSAVLEEIRRAASLFRLAGIHRGDAVALVLPNLPETHFSLWGAEAVATAFPINPMLEAASIGQLLRSAEARIVVTTAPTPDRTLFDKVAEAVAGAPSIRHVFVIDTAAHGFIDAAPSVADRPTRIGQAEVISFATSAAGVSPGAEGIAPMGDDVSSYFCTGGSTGLPKIARRTHANEVANAWMIARAQGAAIGPRSTFFCGLPLFHVNGAMVTGLAPFLAGAHVLIGTAAGYRSPGLLGRFWEVVEEHRVTAFSGVPTLLASLLEVPMGDHDVSSLRFAICGAAPLPGSILRGFEKATGIPLVEGYGLTEATCASTCNPIRGERRAGSVGIPLPFQKVMVWDGDRVAVPTGSVGRVLLRGPNVFAGYLEAAHEAGIWIDVEGRRWLDTGDLGSVDAEGYLWLTGRAKDVIIRGGHNIDPAVIEDALGEHPAVALAAAVGRPDARLGEVPVAHVQFRSGESASEKDLIAFAAARIGERAAWPWAVRAADALPLTSVGKIYKPALRSSETEHVVLETLRDIDVQPIECEFGTGTGGRSFARIRLANRADADVAAAALSHFSFETQISSAPDPFTG